MSTDKSTGWQHSVDANGTTEWTLENAKHRLATVYEGTQRWHWYTLPVRKGSPVGTADTAAEAMALAREAVKAAQRPHIVMKVRIEAEVVVEVDRMPRGLLQNTVIDAVEQAMARKVESIPALSGAVTSLSVSRGTSGYTYFGRGREALTESADPMTASLSDVLAKAVRA